jgi:hypothetical protein
LRRKLGLHRHLDHHPNRPLTKPLLDGLMLRPHRRI